MNQSLVAGAFRTARWAVLLSFVATAILAAALVGERVVFDRSSREAADASKAATAVAADILLADERLTMSANMAAATGEGRWVRRYQSFIPDIDKAIATATGMASPAAAQRFDQETRLANDRLVDMEARSFAAVEAGDLARARAILDGGDYAAQKKLLADGSGRLLQSLRQDTMARLDAVRSNAGLFLAALIASGLAGFVTLWRLISRKIATSEGDHRRAELCLNFMARHDELTGLPNRRTFVEEVSQLLTRRQSTGTGLVAVAMADVDNFKDINDTLGHQCGDALIRLVPDRLRGCLPEGGVLARFGGDEFTMALTVTDEAEARARFAAVSQLFAEPFDVDGHLLAITVSVGVALAPAHASTSDDLLRLADIALYEAKNEGRNRAHVFAPVLDERKRERKEIEADLRVALREGQLALHYQPLMSNDGLDITGLEALVRWPHPERGMVSPGQFIPVAEQSGLILAVGEWVLQRAFEDSGRWPGLPIAINLSPMQLRDPGFLDTVQRLLAAANADPKRIELEVTESLLLEDNGRVRKLLADLRHMGFSISLDDFGTGYSSLSYLRRFDFNKIKIDQSFTKGIETSADAAQIVHCVVNLGHALGLTVTAEGVETSAQHRFLAAAGCQQMQGYLFARPMAADGIDELLLRQSPSHTATAA